MKFKSGQLVRRIISDTYQVKVGEIYTVSSYAKTRSTPYIYLKETDSRYHEEWFEEVHLEDLVKPGTEIHFKNGKVVTCLNPLDIEKAYNILKKLSSGEWVRELGCDPIEKVTNVRYYGTYGTEVGTDWEVKNYVEDRYVLMLPHDVKYKFVGKGTPDTEYEFETSDVIKGNSSEYHWIFTQSEIDGIPNEGIYPSLKIVNISNISKKLRKDENKSRSKW